jgi:hypothetical protein
MAYIGKTPVIGNFQVCDAISVVDAQAAYTMQVGGVNVSPESANHMLVSLNGILQAPTSSFTVSGSTITFASNLVTGDVIDFIQILGNVLDLGVPSDNTVTTAKSDSSVSLAKLTATGTKDATTFLRGDNTFNTPPLGGITEADQWRLTAQAQGNQNPLSANLERVDTDGFGKIGTGMSQSSGIFTFPSTGVWKIEFDTHFSYNGSTRQIRTFIMTTTDNSSYGIAAYSNSSIVQAESNYTQQHGHASFIFNVTNTTTHKVRFDVDSSVTILIQGETDSSQTYMTFIRLGDSV